MSEDVLQQAILLSGILKQKESRRKLFNIFPDTGPLSYLNYPKVIEFFKASKEHRERLLIAGNRTGKSEAGAYEVACHLTGHYPHWWTGRRFNKPIKVWVAGDTAKTTRDIIQDKLLGAPNEWGTGMIPGDQIDFGSISRNSGVADAIDTMSIKHVNGWSNTLAFKSYDQKRKAFQGTEQDIIWLDEEPPIDVYTECLMRTMTTKGLIILTFTPLSGMTEVVMSFLGNDPNAQEHTEGKFFVTMTWDDAPHLSQEEKDDLWKSIPHHQRDARAKGIPTLGAGAIYPLEETDITVDDFKIPDHWPRAYGMDVGWNNTAMCLMYRDIDTQTDYVTSVYKRGQAEPLIHADAISTQVGKGTQGYIDPASRGRSQKDGVQLYETYTSLDLNLQFANNAVESGLLLCWQRLSTGRIKIFKSCTPFFSEFKLYRRDDKGKIVKKNDHIMDAFRYVVMSADEALASYRAPKPQAKEDPVNLYKDIHYGLADYSMSWLGG